MQYQYTGEGDRLSQTANDGTSSTTTQFLLDLNSGLTQVLGETSMTGSQPASQTWYLRGLDVIAAEQNPTGAGAWSYFGQDGLGSIRQSTDGSGNILSSQSYDSYGNLLNTTGASGTSLGFSGQYTDSATRAN